MVPKQTKEKSEACSINSKRHVNMHWIHLTRKPCYYRENLVMLL